MSVPSTALLGVRVFNPLDHGIRGEPLMVSAADFNRVASALKNLRDCIDMYEYHGMPGFTDRAEAYLAIAEADVALTPNTIGEVRR